MPVFSRYSALYSALAIFCLCVIVSPDAAAQEALPYRVITVAEGLEHPWGMAVMPDKRLLVTERAGRLRIVTPDGTVSPPLSGVPEVFHQEQGGLLDVALDPDFSTNRRIYLSYAEADSDGRAGTAVARATLRGQQLTEVEVIFRQHPKTKGGNHFGSRLVFDRDGHLFITLGERFNEMKQAQTLDNHLGKIVRILPDGSVPPDNPFVENDAALPEIWSYGHRNIQGAALHPETGKLWIHEHGPRGGDEINLPEAGKNYGWPQASKGIHYWMLPIASDHAGKGFVEPIHHWTPSIAPSGMMFYTGDAFPAWHGNLFAGALVGQHVARLELDGETVVQEHQLLEERKARFRDVAQAPDGGIYLLTDAENGELLKLMPDSR